MEIAELMEVANFIRFFVSCVIFLFMLMLGLKTIGDIMNPYKVDTGEKSIQEFIVIQTILASILLMVNYNFLSDTEKIIVKFSPLVVLFQLFLVFFLSYKKYKKEEAEQAKEERIARNITPDVSISKLKKQLENLLPFENDTVSNDVLKLVDRLEKIQGSKDKTIKSNLQSFANKYLSILYTSLNNYKELNKPTTEVSNNMIKTLKTVNTALDKILDKSDEILSEDINTTSTVITALLEPKVTESPFQNQEG